MPLSTPLPEDISRLVVDRVDDRPTLASIARVSRTWSGPAFDKLWSRLDNLYALAKCMLVSLWEEYETREVDRSCRRRNRIIIAKHPDVADPKMLGDRFFANTLRVRELVLGSSSTTRLKNKKKRVPADVDESVLSLWIRCLTHQEIFPNLHSVAVYWHALHNPLYMQLIPESRRPQLRSLSVMTGGTRSNSAISENALHHVIDSCPGLQHLNIEARSDWLRSHLLHIWTLEPSLFASSLTCEKTVISSTLRLTNLRKLSTFLIIPTEALRQFAAMPNLETLDCKLKPDSEGFSDFPSNGFAALQSLVLVSGDATTALSFLKVVCGTRLQMLDVTMNLVDPAERVNNIKALFKAIYLHPSRDSLREIHIHSTLTSWRDGDQEEIDQEETSLDNLAQPLFGMPQLRVLSLPQLDIRLDDAGYTRLANALPSLTHFTLLHPPLLSLSTIQVIADKASPETPPLLGLRPENTQVLYKKKVDLSPVSMNVDTLCLSEISSGDAYVHAVLAHNLLNLFPNLEKVARNTEIDPGSEEFERYASVNRALNTARHGSIAHADRREDDPDEKTYPIYRPTRCFAYIPHWLRKSRTKIPNTEPKRGVWGHLFF